MAEAAPATAEHLTRRERFSQLLRTAHVSSWWFGVSLATAVILVAAVLAYTHLPTYLETYPVRWWMVLWAVVGVVLQFLGYTVALRGASTAHLPFLDTFALELGESVTGMATPESVGSFALSMRYLDRAGLTPADAVAATGLSSFVTTMVASIVLPIAVVVAASTIDYASLKAYMPSQLWEIVIAVLAVSVVVTVLVKAPTVRHKAMAGVRKAGTYLATVVHQPRRGLTIALGELVTLLGMTGVLWLLVAAVRQHANVAALVVVVMVASTASSVVPIPGGLGAPEAILLAGLVSIGVEHKAAVICSVSYRLLTYWLPVIPGLLCLRSLHRRDRI
jgi:glycosyltransferase 2 family protein